MTISNLIAITAIVVPLIISIVIFAFWLGRKIIGLEVTFSSVKDNQEVVKQDLKNYIKLFFNDERLAFEKKFDEITKLAEKIREELRGEIKIERHRLNNLQPKIDYIEKKWREKEVS